MKNDTFEALVPGLKCSGPKSIEPKLFPGQSILWVEFFSGLKCALGPSIVRAEVSVGPKLSLGQTGCEPCLTTAL